MAEIDEESYLQTLHELLSKKNAMLKDKNQFTRKAKLAKYVLGKGYESNLVWDLIRSADYLE
jgi:regulatory protein